MMQYHRDIHERRVYEELRGAIDSRNCILIAGSALAAHARTDDGRHPPFWQGLLNDIINWCIESGVIIDPQVITDIQSLFSQGFLVEVGQEIEEYLADPLLRQQCLRNVLLSHEAKASEIHRLIVEIPFRAYLTTSYDLFIETAYSAVKGIALPRFYETSLENMINVYNRYEPFILKLHGDVDNPESIILGDRTYDRLLRHSVRYRDYLQILFSTSSVLFLGLGGTDPDLDGLLSKITAFDIPINRHWMLIPEGQLPPLKAKRLHKDKHIDVIYYQPDPAHTQLAEFLRSLAVPPSATREQASDYTPPEAFSSRSSVTTRRLTVTPSVHSSVNLFYSYARPDEELRDELEKHLSNLRRQGVITNWHERNITAGMEREQEISTHLDTAQVILLLVSPDFLASDYSYNREMTRALERHNAGEACVIPVILRPVDWEGAPFGHLQSLPKDAKPITSWSNRDEAFTDVARGIRRAIAEFTITPDLTRPIH